MLRWLTLYLYLIYYAQARPKSRVKTCLYYLYYQMIELHYYYYDYDYYEFDSHPSNNIRLLNCIGHQCCSHWVTSDNHTLFLNHCSIHSCTVHSLKHHLTDSNPRPTNSTTVVLDSDLHSHSHVHFSNWVFYCSSCW